MALRSDKWVKVERPGISIVGIDPGGTTGVAVWDAWDGVLYADQIDSGRGRKVRYRVHSGVIESSARHDVMKSLGMKRADGGWGKAGEQEINYVIERGVAQVVCDLVMAVGPRSIVVCEDFVLGWGQPGEVRSSARAGLSPVRLAARIDSVLWDRGVYTGDAWRQWVGHGWGGRDVRGWNVAGGAVPPLWLRLQAVEKWRLQGVGDAFDDPSGSGGWVGIGSKWLMQMPNLRGWANGVDKTKKLLRDKELWVASMPHGMDAVMHIQAVARNMGSEVLQKPERIWKSGAKIDGKRITAKSTELSDPPGL